MSNEIKPTCLFVGPVATRSGYGDDARSRVAALIKWDKFDVKIASTRWGACPMTELDNDNWLSTEIKKRLLTVPMQQQPELFIQLSIPNEFQTPGKFNVGITAGIESTVPKGEWIEGLNRMNLNIVPSKFTKDVFEKVNLIKTHPDGRKEPMKMVKPMEVSFEGVDTSIYKKTTDKSADIDAAIDPIPETFAFLFVGHWLQGDIGADRKDVGMLVKVFSEVFKNKKNKPALILKTSGAGFSQVDKHDILRKIHKIRELMIGDLPNIYLIHGDLTPIELNRLYNHPKVKAHVSFTHGEGFCVPRNTQIISDRGIINVQDIKPGDEVITHAGRWRRVIQPLNRYYQGKMVDILAFNTRNSISFTPNHQLYTYDVSSDSFHWKSSSDISIMDYLVYPIVKNNNLNMIKISDFIKDYNIEIKQNGKLGYIHSDKTSSDVLNEICLTRDVGKLFGLFVAGGSLGPRNEIYFSLNKNEKETYSKDIIDLMKNIFNIEYFSIADNDNNSITIRFYSTIVNRLLESLFGRGALNKKIPVEIMKANSEFKEGFISGLFFGDGYITPTSVDLSLVSEDVIKNTRLILLELGIISCFDNNRGNIRCSSTKIQHKHVVHRIRITQKKSINNIFSIFKLSGYYSSYIPNNECYPANVRLKSFIKNVGGVNYYITKVKSINVFDIDDIVYNLSVEGDESYLTENYVVHNCRPLLEASLSGKPIIASNWSGHLDFLPENLAILLPGTLGNIPPSACNEWLISSAQWLNVNYSVAAQKLEEVFTDYLKFIPSAEKLRQQNSVKFTEEAGQKLFIEILEKHLPVFEKKIAITLPKFKKIVPKVIETQVVSSTDASVKMKNQPGASSASPIAAP